MACTRFETVINHRSRPNLGHAHDWLHLSLSLPFSRILETESASVTNRSASCTRSGARYRPWATARRKSARAMLSKRTHPPRKSPRLRRYPQVRIQPRLLLRLFSVSSLCRPSAIFAGVPGRSPFAIRTAVRRRLRAQGLGSVLALHVAGYRLRIRTAKMSQNTTLGSKIFYASFTFLSPGRGTSRFSLVYIS